MAQLFESIFKKSYFLIKYVMILTAVYHLPTIIFNRISNLINVKFKLAIGFSLYFHNPSAFQT